MGSPRRIEQTSGNILSLNYGSVYPALLKLEQEGAISCAWGVSDNNRKAKFYRLTRTGRKQLERERRDWCDMACGSCSANMNVGKCAAKQWTVRRR